MRSCFRWLAVVALLCSGHGSAQANRLSEGILQALRGLYVHVVKKNGDEVLGQLTHFDRRNLVIKKRDGWTVGVRRNFVAALYRIAPLAPLQRPPEPTASQGTPRARGTEAARGSLESVPRDDEPRAARRAPAEDAPDPRRIRDEPPRRTRAPDDDPPRRTTAATDERTPRVAQASAEPSAAAAVRPPPLTLRAEEEPMYIWRPFSARGYAGVVTRPVACARACAGTVITAGPELAHGYVGFGVRFASYGGGLSIFPDLRAQLHFRLWRWLSLRPFLEVTPAIVTAGAETLLQLQLRPGARFHFDLSRAFALYVEPLFLEFGVYTSGSGSPGAVVRVGGGAGAQFQF